jgi:hypothetical protein
MMSAVVLETCWGDNIIYILQNKKLDASSESQKIDLYYVKRRLYYTGCLEKYDWIGKVINGLMTM